MRHYIPKNSEYRMDHDTYMMMYYLIRAYPALCRRYADMLQKDAAAPGDATSRAAVISAVGGQIDAVAKAIARLREKYTNTCTGEAFDALGAFNDYGVFGYFRSRAQKSECPSTRSHNRFKNEFAWQVAKNLYLL